MRKIAIFIATITLIYFSLFAFASCGDGHVHEYSVENVSDESLKTPASCTASAEYYYSCECGALGTKSFTYGDKLPHNYTLNTATSASLKTPASCSAPAEYYYSCECGALGTESFSYGDKLNHSYTISVASSATFKSAASCSAPAEYYYSCECGALGTESFSYGDKLNHSYTISVASSATFKSAASCSAPAEYYYSCECGAIGTKSFAYGEKLSHNYTLNTVTAASLKTPASCTAPAEYYYSCECGALDTNSFVYGERDFSNHSSAASYVSDKTEHYKTYSCCGVSDAAVSHSWSAGVCSLCSYECIHEGGIANCSILKRCTLCSSQYGEYDPDAHSHTRREIITESTCSEAGIERYYCLCGDYIERASEELGEHNFRDWSVYVEASCKTVGENVRSCADCGFIELSNIGLGEHSYTAISEYDNSCGEDCVALVCKTCGDFAGEGYLGVYLDSQEAMLLYDCTQDFSFDVYSPGGIEDIYYNLVVADLFWSNDVYNGSWEMCEELDITDIGDSIYRISPKNQYKENRTYFASVSGDVKFTDKYGSGFMFRTVGDAGADIQYNDAVFLKALADEKNLELSYTSEYDDELLVYLVRIPESYGVDTSFIGKLIVLGDCTSFEEAYELDESDVLIGKVEAVVSKDGISSMLLSVPSVEDIYASMSIAAGELPELDESLVSAEFKNMIAESIIKSDDFAAAVTSANIAASSYAQSMGLQTESKLDISMEDIKIEAKVATVDLHTVEIVITIKYAHVIPIKDDTLDLGKMTFDMTFETTMRLNIDVNSNIMSVLNHEIKKSALSLDCTVTTEVKNSFDLAFSLSMDYGYKGGEMRYIVNLEAGRVHRHGCRFAPTVLPPLGYVDVTYSELSDYLNDPESAGCGVCRPFTLGESKFVINTESGTIHCSNCLYVSNTNKEVLVSYEFYPIGEGAKDCSVCKPETHTKSLDKYLEESAKDASFDEMFNVIKTMLAGKADGEAESPIGKDTDPRITIKLYCFEVPIYVEPRIDLDLKANFKLHYSTEVKNSVFVALVNNGNGYAVVGGCNVETPKKLLEIDVTGSFKLEMGVMTEVRLGVRYLSKQVYIGVFGEAGIYMDAGGIYHLNTEMNEHYYGARAEIGIYTEVKCTYRVIGIIPADSFDILAKKYYPIFESGDERIYNRFTSYEDEMSFANTSVYYLDNALLEVNYYDLKAEESKIGRLNWSEKKQYGFVCTFTDENGEEVDYIYFENGALKLTDEAPENFTVTMTVKVYDKIVAEDVEEYFGTHNPGGCAIFLEEKTVTVSYRTSDPYAIEDYLGTYEGWFSVDYYTRSSLISIHKKSELYNDDKTLRYFANILNYIRVDENGNPQRIFTVEYLKELLCEVESEYVYISYSSPRDNIFDNQHGIYLASVHYDEGLVFSNIPIYAYVSSDDYVTLYFDIPTDVTDGVVRGNVWSDMSRTELVGEYELEPFEID